MMVFDRQAALLSFMKRLFGRRLRSLWQVFTAHLYIVLVYTSRGWAWAMLFLYIKRWWKRTPARGVTAVGRPNGRLGVEAFSTERETTTLQAKPSDTVSPTIPRPLASAWGRSPRGLGSGPRPLFSQTTTLLLVSLHKEGQHRVNCSPPLTINHCQWYWTKPWTILLPLLQPPSHMQTNFSTI